jgi:signal peptidase II
VKCSFLSGVGGALSHQVLPGPFPALWQWHVLKNTGIAWSLLEQHPQALKYGLTFLLLSLCLLAWRQQRLWLWVLCGAAAANVLDRWLYGGVIDYIELTCISYPVFNLADMAIVLAVFWGAGQHFLRKPSL